MSSVLHLNVEFEGHRLSTLTYQGRPVWIAREIGVVCGYAQGGKRLVTLITTEWADEYIEGIDYLLVTGSELAGLSDLLSEGTQHVPFENRRGLLLLLEPGLYLALVKTRKPIGKRLRRFLVEHVLPQLARHGRYLPESTVMTESEPMEPKRLDIRRVELEERQFQVSELRTTLANLDQLGCISPEVRAAMQVCTAEVALGTELTPLKPVIEDGWLSPSEIASQLGVTAHRVGLTISALGLRGVDGLSRTILNKARGHNRTVASYTYCPAAIDQIEAELGRLGHLKPTGA